MHSLSVTEQYHVILLHPYMCMQVLSWQPGCDELCVASVPLRGRGDESDTMANPMSQKMIVCHDMMGGYINDKFVQGSRYMYKYRVHSKLIEFKIQLKIRTHLHKCEQYDQSQPHYIMWKSASEMSLLPLIKTFDCLNGVWNRDISLRS